MESFINQYLNDFMTTNDLFTKQQMGFRKDHLTIEGCSGSVKDVLDASNDNLTSVAVYIDLAKAFNTINHDIIIAKLSKLGLPAKFITLMVSYLNSRTQHTIFNGQESSNRAIADGVPQGSILGPALFLCYINDLPEIDLGCKVSLYADNTVLYSSGDNLSNVLTSLNHSQEKTLVLHKSAYC